LLTTERRYDLITSEPPPPKHTGVVSLYTREYFELVYDRLAEGGINTYWLPVHSLVPEDSLAIIRAYCDVFEDCTLWSGAGLNWMLVATRGVRGGQEIPHLERIRNLHAALDTGNLHTLPTWWLEIDQDQLDAMARHLASGAPERAHRYRLAVLALADRDFAKAADHFGEVRGPGVDPKLVAYLRLYSLCRAADFEAAAAYGRERFGGTRLSGEDRAYLEWLSATVAFVADL
jgi:hypothetical protein